MNKQIQYNMYNLTDAANYNSLSTSRPDSFIEIIKRSSIIIKDESIQLNNKSLVNENNRQIKN